jgi:epoxyqueuosine reductase
VVETTSIEKEVTPVDTYSEELLRHLAEQGYQGRIVSIKHLPELQKEIKGRFNQGLFDEEFYQQRLAFFRFEVPETLPDAKSIIVVAVPRPQAQAIFTFKGKRKALILPPTYVAYEQTTSRVADFLTRILKEKGHKIARTTLPLKILAVRSGLAEYGRNNITYISGMGSFFQLAAFYSDLPCLTDQWREARMMEKCEKCQACLRSCPTGAISSDRFLLHGERCMSFLNEKKGDVPFPRWVDPSWHNCLYGCLHCQRVCPEDKRFMNWIVEKEEFSQEETELLLKGQTTHLPNVTLEKLKNLDLSDPDSLSNLSRNLRVFSESSKTGNLEHKHTIRR